MRYVIGSGGGSCFPAGVMVMTPSGETPIEKLVIGDEVISFDYTGAVSVSRVDVVHTHPSDRILSLKFWGGALRITANHWVLNQYNSFALAGTLTEHDSLVDSLGHLRPVISTSDDGIAPVYNLTVTPNHTFIADGIRVHNGGRGMTRPIVGAGGGGSDKGGGGSAYVAVEDPDSLQSHQYAKVVDLISEGEIGGLVNGLRSVYLEGSPAMAADGSMNVSGITLDFRNGTNGQSAMTGFSTTESEVPVGTEIKAGYDLGKVVRIDKGADAARVTLGFPRLTQQDTTNGDLHGASVQMSIYVNNNGGGYAPLNLGWIWNSVAASGSQVDVSNASGVGMTVTLGFPFTAIEYDAAYQAAGSGGG